MGRVRAHEEFPMRKVRQVSCERGVHVDVVYSAVRRVILVLEDEPLREACSAILVLKDVDVAEVAGAVRAGGREPREREDRSQQDCEAARAHCMAAAHIVDGRAGRKSEDRGGTAQEKNQRLLRIGGHLKARYTATVCRHASRGFFRRALQLSP